MPAYDGDRFFPPAPVASVRLRNPANSSAELDVPMLIGSGADATMLPEGIIASLGVDTSRSAQFGIIGVEGTIMLSKAVSLEMVFLGRRFRGEFLLTPNEYGILGRNVLNQIPLLLDGPGLFWSEVLR